MGKDIKPIESHKAWSRKMKINSGIITATITAIVVEALTLLIEHLKGII